MNYIYKLKNLLSEKLSNRGQVFYHVIFLLYAIFFVGRSIDFHFLTHYINGMDTYQWLNFKQSMKESLFIWNPDASGKIEPMAFTAFFYNLFLQILETLTNHLILSINIYWVFFIYFLQVPFFYFYRIFLGNNKALLATALTFLNTTMITTLYAPMIMVNVALVAFPLMFFLLHSYVFKKKFIYAFIYIIFQILLFRVLNILILTNILVPLLFFILFRSEILNKQEFFNKVVLVWGFSVLACMMSIINIGMSFSDVSSNTNVQTYNNESISHFYRDRDSLLNVLRMTNHFSLADDKPEFSGFLYFKFSNLYMQSEFFIVVSFIFFGLLIASFIKNIKDKRVITIMACLILLIFLAKTFNSPWGAINQWLYSNKVYMIFFRSGPKYFMYLIIPLSVLAIFLGKKKSLIFYSLIFLYISAHAFLIFFYAKPVAKYWNTVLPSGYLGTSSQIDALKDGNKILILPGASRFAGETYYEDGYAGYNRLQALSSKDIVSRSGAFGGSDEYNQIFNTISNSINTDYAKVDSNASLLNYRYVLVEKDAVYYSALNLSSIRKTGTEIEKALNKNIWNKVFSNNTNALYKINDELFDGKISIANSKLAFSQINPVKYKIHISALKKAEQLSFLEAFHSGWKVYLEPISKNNWCQSREYFAKLDVTECENNRKLFEIKDLIYLWKKSVFDASHGVSNQYANGWTIDPEYIKQNYPKEYYKENIDGSVDVELVLYFKPQNYFFMGLFISGGTILSCLIYLWRSRKNKNFNTNDLCVTEL